MKNNERDERKKRLGIENNSFPLFPIVNIFLAISATLILYFGFSHKEDKINKNLNIDNNKREQNESSKIEKNNPITTNKKDNSVINKPSANPEQNFYSIYQNKQNFPLDRKTKYFPSIEQKIITLANQRNLPTNKLSFSLINLSNSSCDNPKLPSICQYLGYQDYYQRYPASLAKLYWLIILFTKYRYGQIKIDDSTMKEAQKMIQDSDNESASKIVDLISDLKSTPENIKIKLNKEEFKQWKEKRESLNKFFIESGYKDININQKTFPIPYLGVEMPEGADLQLRYPDSNTNQPPIRNYLTTYETAKLLYEIYTNQVYYSNEIKQLLKRNLTPQAWQDIPYNAIEGFLGEGIPDKNAQFYSKMGWTFNNRNDAAIIISPDNKTRYILVIFGDDPSYYNDKKFLPEVSKIVYEEMRKLSQ